MSYLRIILLASATGFLGFSAHGGPLTEARVTKIINRVQVVDPAKGSHPAALHETIKDAIELKTGVKSRSELLFQDNTLTRLGPETSFSFKAGTRDMSLEKGTMLLQVPKGQGGAQIRTAAVTAAITGTTILMSYTPGKAVKVLVLEGSLRLSINGRFGDSVVLRPGRMVLMRPNAKKIPTPVLVDLKKIVQTSSLVKMSKNKGGTASLPSAALIENEILQQEHDKGTKSLIETDVVIHGSGTTAMNSTGNIIDVLARTEQGRTLTVATTTSSGSTGSVPPVATPDATPAATPAPTAAPATTPLPTATPGSSPTPAPSATPDDSGDDNQNGDHGKNKGKDKNKDTDKDPGKGREHGLSLPPPTLDRSRPVLDRAQLSGRETFLPTARSSRNGL